MSWCKNVPVAILSLALCGQALAQSAPMSEMLKVGMAGDKTDVLPAMRGSRLVTFRYSPDVSFAIRALDQTFVNIELPVDEVVQGFYLSDGTMWEYHIAGDKRRVLVKPLAPGLVNTGTLVSNKRSYELTMMSVSAGDAWFQRVQWELPGAQGGAALYWGGQTASPVQSAVAKPASAGSIADVDPSDLNFGYRIKGRAAFAPSTVFDDGVRTWFRFDGVQDLPAIFAKTEGKLEVVDYAAQGAYVVVPAISKEFVLRLRKSEVKVERKR